MGSLVPAYPKHAFWIASSISSRAGGSDLACVSTIELVGNSRLRVASGLFRESCKERYRMPRSEEAVSVIPRGVLLNA